MNGSFQVKDRLYPLHFTVNHICLMEESLGQKLPALLSGSMYGVRALLWCGLMGEKVTLEEAGSLMQEYFLQGGTLETLSRLLADAMEDAGFFHLPVQKRKT